MALHWMRSLSHAHAPICLLSFVLCLAPAVALMLSPVVEAAKKEKGKPVAAKKKAAPSSSSAKKSKTADTAVVPAPASTASQAWETPPKGDRPRSPPHCRLLQKRNPARTCARCRASSRVTCARCRVRCRKFGGDLLNGTTTVSFTF